MSELKSCINCGNVLFMPVTELITKMQFTVCAECLMPQDRKELLKMKQMTAAGANPYINKHEMARTERLFYKVLELTKSLGHGNVNIQCDTLM